MPKGTQVAQQAVYGQFIGTQLGVTIPGEQSRK